MRGEIRCSRCVRGIKQLYYVTLRAYCAVRLRHCDFHRRVGGRAGHARGQDAVAARLPTRVADRGVRVVDAALIARVAVEGATASVGHLLDIRVRARAVLARRHRGGASELVRRSRVLRVAPGGRSHTV